MLSLLNDWGGLVEVDGMEFESIGDVTTGSFSDLHDIHIILRPCHKTTVEPVVQKAEYRITVKKYMTQKSSPSFDFMAKWNNDNPMPLRTMVGVKEKETPGMVYMKLHGDIYAETIHTCMKCGRMLTNKVSQYFGIGPECGGHNYVNPFNSEQELKAAVESYRKQLQNIEWEGWVVKSAILEQEEL